VVVVGQLEDLFPDQPSAGYAKFVSKPELRIVPGAPWNPSRAKWLAYEWGTRFRANGLLSVLRRYSEGLDLRFQMGPARSASMGERSSPSTQEMSAWLNFYARQFRSSTKTPLILVYLPQVPRLEGNGWAMQDAVAASSLMEQIFTENGWYVVNMGNRFVENFEHTGRLPRGFNNSQPGSGHLNQDGHRLVSETLAERLRTMPMLQTPP
jgi:hypothetical protein